jgi:TonB-linked SusC/RagA family outer membrane protein
MVKAQNNVGSKNVESKQDTTINSGFVQVKGSVVDMSSGKPLFDVSISLKGIRSKTVQTDKNGSFTVFVPTLFNTISVSYPGYQSKEQAIFGASVLKIKLAKENANVAEMLLALPYSNQFQQNLNGSYAIVTQSQDKIGEKKNIHQLINGTVSGLQSTTFSGVPDEGANLSIRGISSLFLNTTPLVVVDGFPIDNTLSAKSIINGNVYNYLSDINVKDIESVTVLKDAAAISIYGTEGANGVILVKTTSGTSGKTYLDVDVQTTLGEKFRDIPVLNGNDYRLNFQNLLYNQGFNNQTIAQTYPFLFNTDKTNADYWRYANNTNWQDVIKRNSFAQDYHLSLRGGDGTSKYLFSVGYKNQEGEITGVDVSRFNARFNLDFKMLKNLSIGTRIYYSKTDKTLVDQGSVTENNPYYIALTKPSFLSVHGKSALGEDLPGYEAGAYDNLNNPLALANEADNKISNNWLLGNVFMNLDLAKGVSTKLNMGLDWRNMDENRFLPSLGRIMDNYGYIRSSEQQFTKSNQIWVEHTFSVDKLLRNMHQINFLAGYNIKVNNRKDDYGYSVNSPSDDFRGLGSGTKVRVDGGSITQRNFSMFANVDYALMSKYLLSAGVRADASSLFRNASNAGFKISSQPFAAAPYLGLTWKVKGESFLRDVDAVSDFKLRTSVGVNLNQQIDPTLNQSYYQSKYYYNIPGLVLEGIANKDLKWESTQKFNVGGDLSLFNNSLRMTLDYFYHKTTDMLLPTQLDGIAGFVNSWENGGEMLNKGVEVGLAQMGEVGNFTWNVGFNIAFAQNKVLSLPNGNDILLDYYGSQSITRVGQAAGQFYGYKSLGVFKDQASADLANLTGDKNLKFMAGDFQFEDVNGDHRIDKNDMQVIGNPNPDFYGGITASVSYKNIDLETLLSYAYGGAVMNVLRSKLEVASGYENQSVAVKRAWKADGDITNIPRTNYGDPLGNGRPSSNWIEDGSYLKMRTLTLAYNFNKKMGFVRNARLYVTGYNLFTLTNYLGLDPEFAVSNSPFVKGYDFGAMPQSRAVMVGVKLGL